MAKHKHQPNGSKKNSRRKRKEEALRQQRRKAVQEKRQELDAVKVPGAQTVCEASSPRVSDQNDLTKNVNEDQKTNQRVQGDLKAGITGGQKNDLEEEFLSEEPYQIKISAGGKDKKKGKKKDKNNDKGGFPYSTALYFMGLMIYYELLFHGFFFGLGNGNTLRILLISVILGGCIGLLTGLFPKVVNHILTITGTLMISVIFMIQFLYHAVFQNFCAFFGLLKYTNQAADNFDVVLLNMKQHWVMMLLWVLPILLVSVFSHKLLNYRRRSWKYSLILLGSVLLLYIGGVVSMKLWESEPSGAYEMYRYYSSVDMTVEKLGVMETLVVDVRQGIAGAVGQDDGVQFYASSDGSGLSGNQNTSNGVNGSNGNDVEDTSEDGQVLNNGKPSDHNMDDGQSDGGMNRTGDEDKDGVTTEEGTEAPIDTSPNVMEIDFDEIAGTSGNQTIASLCEYFENLTPTNRNEYTGYFKDFNVIQISAEGFSGYALETDLFPTLSMMAEEGFVFDNYYSPLWYGSTLGGEYANLMGSMPKNGGYLSLSHGAANGNTFLFSLGNQLKSLGYETYAFHNNSYTYYDRNLTHPALGYTWIANGSGLDAQTNEYGTVLWPQSDLVMIQNTFDEYTAKEPFHLYYMTVSGHVVYSFGGNAMSQKNREIVEDLEYSETTKAYLACQYELEKAMEELVMQLKAHDLYENTVVILTGDHVPYNNMEILDELAGRDLEDTFEAYKSTLIIWSGAMEHPIHVEKVCSSIDILPTVSNLLGLEYDSRLLIGQDILSDSEGLVLFADRSFITDRYAYSAARGTVVSDSNVEISDEELAEKRAFVSNKFTAADAITQYDFYKYVLPYKKYASAFEQAE